MAHKTFSPDSTTRSLKTVAGTSALDPLAIPTVVQTGLSTILGVALTLQKATAPGDSTSTLTYTASGGALSVYGWMPESGADPTLAASTGSETFGYVVFGY